jgi:UDP-N-acetylmuramate dehydrogenase
VATIRAARPAAESTWAVLAAEIRGMAGVHARLDEPMAGHTTMRVGGPADLLVAVDDLPALVGLVRLARARGIPHVVIGRGSDLVVSDAGIRGLVILCRAEDCRIEDRRLTADAGLALARAATLAQRAGLSGLEFGLAIPGTVGGAVWANAGAHGSDVAAILESVTVLRANGQQVVEPAAALALAYRDSRFKHRAEEGGSATAGATAAATATAGAATPTTAGTTAGAATPTTAGTTAGAATPTTAGTTAGAATQAAAWQELILGATFHLIPAKPAEIRARLDEIRRWRREHQPLGLPSAGSVFRNPPGDSAGRLIDACGLKGSRVNGAAISEAHANFIVNAGGASASDVRRLAERVRAAVAERFGVDLVYEVQFMGDWSDWHPEVA